MKDFKFFFWVILLLGTAGYFLVVYKDEITWLPMSEYAFTLPGWSGAWKPY